MEAVSLLNRYDINTARSSYVKTAEEAIKFASGKSIVLKVLSDKALHKTKSGLVALNLKSPNEITNAFNDLYNKAQQYSPYNILAQEMAEPGTEIIIGGNEDPQFGKTILLGLGGIYVEVFKDFSLRICPIQLKDAEEMINELKSSKIIAGMPEQKAMLSDLLLKVSKMLVETPAIKELDLNPVLVYANNYSAVDIRILI
ncbi:MAG: acetate--CoA ligase family protein [Candidatus Micrarchaeaceae archaeon]